MNAYRRLLPLLSIVVMLMITACGGSGTATSGQTSPTPTVVTTSTSEASCPASAGLPAGVNDHGAVVASGSQLSIEAGDSFFRPTCLTRVASGTVTLTVHNSGQALHNLSIPSLNIDMDVPSGQTITVQVQMGSDPLVFFCKYHRSSGMLGALLP